MARPHRTDRGLFTYQDSKGVQWYGVRLWVQRRAHKWQGFAKKDQARAWYEDRKRDLREGRPFPVRSGSTEHLAGTIAHYLIQATNKKGYAGEVVYGKIWTALLGTLALTAITPSHIDRARTALLKAGAKGTPLDHSTVNRYVAWLHHVLQREVQKGVLPRNPCQGLKFKERKAPEVEFTDAEERAMAKELGAYAEIPTLAILTGLRQAELFGLRKADLFLAQGYGKLHDSKGGEPQVFLISQAAAKIFRLFMVQSESPWIFPSPKDRTRPINPKSFYNHGFKAACLRAGIVLSRANGKTFHTLRHTFASRLQQAGVEVKDIKDLGRWKSWKAMERYLKRDTGRLQAAIEKKLTARKPPLAR